MRQIIICSVCESDTTNQSKEKIKNKVFTWRDAKSRARLAQIHKHQLGFRSYTRKLARCKNDDTYIKIITHSLNLS